MNKADLSKFTAPSNFVIDDPTSSFENSRAKESEMGFDEVHHLIDTLYHSDVILNSVSSLIIDAAIFDKPVVTVSFDGWEKDVPITESVLSEQGNEWLQVLLKDGLSPKAGSPEEMKDLINMYLQNPKKDSEKRSEFVKHHCFGLDGKSVDRIVQLVFP